MADDQATFELREPAAPEALLPVDYAPACWLGAAVLILALLLAWLVWRRRRGVSNNPESRRDLARKDASSALERIAAADARAAAVQTSLILRRYLSLAADDPALFETHEEFIARNDALQSLTEAARAACAAGFSRLASLKYAPSVPDLEAGAVVAEARDLLETLHRGFHR